MHIKRIAGSPGHGYAADRVAVWVDEDVSWPKVWRSVRLETGNWLYYNENQGLHFPFAMSSPNSKGGLTIEGTVIGDGSTFHDTEVKGLWSTRAGVVNHYVERGVILTPHAIDVTLHVPDAKWGIGTAIKWDGAFYRSIIKGTGYDNFPFDIVRMPGSMAYVVTREFDWTFETPTGV